MYCSEIGPKVEDSATNPTVDFSYDLWLFCVSSLKSSQKKNMATKLIGQNHLWYDNKNATLNSKLVL